MTAPELAFASASEQARLVRARDVSPAELAALHLERIDRLDGRLGSYVTVCEDEWKKVTDLRARGAALAIEVYLVRNNLLNAKLRLANVEQDQPAMREQLEALVQLHDAHTGLGFAIGHRPLNRSGAAVARKQRAVQVDGAESR